MSQSVALAQPSGEESFSAIGFQVGNERFGARLDSVQEVVVVPPVTRVPMAPPYIVGVVNLHGNIVPLVDIAAKLGLGGTTSGSDARVIVLEIHGEVLGILAERVDKVRHVSTATLRPPPPRHAGIDAELIEAVAPSEGGFVVFLDFPKALAEATDDV